MELERLSRQISAAYERCDDAELGRAVRRAIDMALAQRGIEPLAETQRVAPAQETANRFAALVENTSAKPSTWNPDSRRFDVVLTTDAPVRRWFGDEILSITADAIDLERVRNGVAPLLDAHNAGELSRKLGYLERVWIEGGKLLGTFRLNNSPEADATIEHIKTGVGVSIGYRVLKWIRTAINEEDELEEWTATKWELFEGSLVPVPADRIAMVRSEPPGCAPPVGEMVRR